MLFSLGKKIYVYTFNNTTTDLTGSLSRVIVAYRKIANIGGSASKWSPLSLPRGSQASVESNKNKRRL